MISHSRLFLGILAAGALLTAAPGDEDVVFRSDVNLVRVDAQVVDRSNRAITGLVLDDFVLKEDGKPQQIRNFGSENMPLDVLLLLDVSGSMSPQVERIASAAHQAFRVLGENDRIAIMVFDRSTRVRLPYRQNRDEVERELDRLLRQESFNGGTDITRALIQAADYVGRNARKEARRAVVILTDDQTEFDRDEPRVERAMAKADAVLSALIAPDVMSGRYPSGGGGGRYPRGGGYPGGGGIPGSGGPLGGIILGGPRVGGYPGGSRYPGGGYPGGGGRYPGGGGMGGGHTHSAGTSEIAKATGGDSMPADDASALESTLERLRQRYTLHYNRTESKTADHRIELTLSDTARRRNPDAEVRYRRVSSGGGSNAPADPIMVSKGSAVPVDAEASRNSSSRDSADGERPVMRRRAMVSEPDGARGASPALGASGTAPVAEPLPASSAPAPAAKPGWRRVDDPEPAAASGPKSNQAVPDSPGWRKVQ